MGLETRSPTVSPKAIVIAAITVVVLVAAGVYAGYTYAEREVIKRELNASLLRIALNLQVIGSIRNGKAADAIRLLSTTSETDLLYLKTYDHVDSANSDFVRRKKNVLSALATEWEKHPRIRDDKDAYFKSDPEWQQYRRELENYVKQN